MNNRGSSIFHTAATWSVQILITNIYLGGKVVPPNVGLNEKNKMAATYNVFSVQTLRLIFAW